MKTVTTCMTPHDYDVIFDITVGDDYSHNSSIVTNKSMYLLQMFCIAVLVAATVAISAINEVEDHYNDHGSTTYEHADSYRRAAI